MSDFKPNPKILAEVESDWSGCDKEFDPRICLMRHYAERKKEEQGKRNKYEPCAYCPRVMKYLNKNIPEGETEEMTEKTPIAKIPKPGTYSPCLECDRVKLIAAGGLCHKCYRTPDIKKKYKFQDRGWAKKLKSKPDTTNRPRNSIKPSVTENVNSGQNAKRESALPGRDLARKPAIVTGALLNASSIITPTKPAKIEPLLSLIARRRASVLELEEQIKQIKKTAETWTIELLILKTYLADLESVREEMAVANCEQATN